MLRTRIGGWPAYLNNNIIAQAEFRHQRYIIQNSRSGRGWIILAVVMLLPAIMTSFALTALAISGQSVAPILGIADDRPFGYLLAVVLTRFTPVTMGLMLLITMNIAAYIVIMLVTVALSANSITREKQKGTWEVLLLTNMDASRLVLGKWWASLRAMAGDHIMLAILRMGIFSLVIAETHDRLPVPLLALPAGLFYTVLMILFVLAFTALDAAFTVALGIALPLSTLPRPIMVALVLGGRFTGIVLNIILGMLLAAMMLEDGPFILLAAVILLIGLLLNWAAIRAAQAFAVRGQVSAPQEESAS